MNIDSLRDLAVLDGERLQAVWDEIDRLRQNISTIEDQRDGLYTQVHRLERLRQDQPT